MAATVKYGSSGSDVKRLQEALNGAGYGLDVDGIFGEQTQKAVKNYQQANGLNVDGIAGPQTWGSLTGQATGAAATAANAANPNQGAALEAAGQVTEPQTPQRDYQYPAAPTFQQSEALSEALNQLTGAVPGAWNYQQGQGVTDALAALNGAAAAKPEAYQSPYAGTLAQLYDKAINRGAFSYDYSADPLYMTYKDRYTENAKKAMQESMANATALTGGYGNSYAAAAGQQAYDAKINGLNDILLQLYSQAYGRYNDEYDRLMRQIELTQGLDQTEYDRYADRLADYYDQANLMRTLANDEYNREYGQYTDQRADAFDRLNALNTLANNQYNREYGEYAGQLEQYNTERNFDYNLYLQEMAQKLAEEQAASRASSGGGSGGGRSSSGSGSGSADYKTILATAKNMTNSKAYDYISRMMDGGYISPEEGMRILSVEMGLDLSQYATGSGSGSAGGSAAGSAGGGTSAATGGTGIKDVVLKTADRGNAAAQNVLNKLYTAAGVGTTGPVATAAVKARTYDTSAVTQAAAEKAAEEEERKKKQQLWNLIHD